MQDAKNKRRLNSQGARKLVALHMEYRHPRLSCRLLLKFFQLPGSKDCIYAVAEYAPRIVVIWKIKKAERTIHSILQIHNNDDK